jgi:hypothetical protein
MGKVHLTVCTGLLTLLVLAGCEQPRPRCNIARGTFAARYTLRASSGSCTPLVGETLNVQAYTAMRSARDTRPDFDKTSIAIQPDTLGAILGKLADRAEPAAGDQPYAFGPFADNEPDKDDYCTVPTLTLARVRLPMLSEKVVMCTTYPPEPSVDVSYEFSNVRVYTTAAAYGTHFTAELIRREPDCVAEYQVTALYPAVACDAPAPMADGGSDDEEVPAIAPPVLDGGLDAMLPAEADGDAATPMPGCEPDEPTGPRVLDESLCAAAADPSQARATGSGINPDFPVYCDPDLWLCLPRLTGEVR